MKHQLALDGKGAVDDFAHDLDDEDGGWHHGPRCTSCGQGWCIGCADRDHREGEGSATPWLDEDCAATRGDRRAPAA